MARVIHRIGEFLGLRRSIAGLLAMVVLLGVGERMAERFLPLYLMAIGGGFLSIGGLNGLTNFVSAIYSFIGGYVSDRLGEKRALLVFNLCAMAGYVIVITIPSWKAVLIGSVFFLAWSAVSLPATMGVVSKAIPKNKRTMGVSVHSLVRRFPMALGPLLGGMFIELWGERDGVRAAFCAACLMAAVSIVLQQRLIVEDANDAKKPKADASPLRLWAIMCPELRSLLVSDILVRFCEQVPYAFAVIWCTKTIASPVTPVQFGILTTVEMATAVLIYIPVAFYADRAGKKPFVAATFVFFSAFPAVLYFCHSFWPLVAAFVLRGLKEFGEPTRKALIMDLAPEDRKAAMFGFYYLLRDVPVAAAAFSGGWLWSISPAVNLGVAFAFGALGTLWFLIRGRDLPALPSVAG